MNVFDLYAKISLDTSEYESGLEGASGKTSSFGSGIKSAFSTIASVGAVALTAATTAVVAFGKSAIEAGSNFDTSMSQLAATMGTTVDQIQNLRDKAMEMGASTSFSASEAADGLNILAMAGLSAEEQIAGIGTVLDLAAAGAISMSDAASYAVGAVKGFGDSIDNAQYYADLMAKGATLANTSVQGLGEAMSMSAATANSYGQQADSVTLSLLRLAEQNITGSEAATALNRAMADLYAPTDAAKKALKELGVSAYDSSGAARDFNDVVDDLSAALSGYTAEEATAYAATIFTTQGLNAFNKMTATSADTMDRFRDGLENAFGSASEQAATQLDNLSGDVTIFKSALEGAQIVVADKLMPTLREFVQFGTEGLSDVTNAFKEDGLSGAMEAFGTFLSDALAMAIDTIPQMIDAGGQLLGALFDGIVDNIPMITDAAVEVAGTLVTGLIKKLPDIATAGIKLVTTLATSIGDNIDSALSNSKFGIAWDKIKQTATDAFDKIAEAGQKLVDAFSPITNKVVEIKGKFDEYVESGRLMDDITAGITTAIDALASGISMVVTGIADFVTWLTSGSTGASVFQAAVVGIVAAFTAYEIATTAVTVAQTAMHGAQALLTAGQTALNAVMNANPFGVVALAITAVVAAITYLWNTNEDFRIAVTSAWEAIKETAETVWNAVVSFFTETIPEAINVALEYFDNLMNGSISDMSTIEAIVSTVMNNISTIFSTVMAAIQGIVSAVMSAINGDWSGALETLKNTASTVFDGIKTVISNKIDLVKTLVSNGLDAIKGYFSDKLTAAKTTVTNIFEGIRTEIREKINAAKTAVQSAIDAIKAKFNFTWSLPSLKLPHISIRGSFSLNPPSVPRFSISWYKKAMDNAMILNGATIFGAMGGNLLGGGESGSEIVAGTDTLMGMIREATDGGKTETLLREIVSKLSNVSGPTIIVNGADYQTTKDLAETISQIMYRETAKKEAALA